MRIRGLGKNVTQNLHRDIPQMAFLLDAQELKTGLVIFRRADVKHRNWYCRIKLPNADRYKTVCLKTADIDAARETGLAGVVIGANLASGALDEKTTARLAQHAAGLELTLHRSVDLMPRPLEAVDIAIALGFRTILTSGGQLKAPDGAETIAAMVARAGDRLEILGGSGLNPGNVAAFIQKTGVKAVHGSFSAPWPEIDPNLVRFGFIGNDARETSRATVSQVRAAIDSLG